jgi:hypothetical protein
MNLSAILSGLLLWQPDKGEIALLCRKPPCTKLEIFMELVHVVAIFVVAAYATFKAFVALRNRSRKKA